jgi:hypothetical protein
MKTALKKVIGLTIILTAGSVSGIILDPMWMFSDDAQIIYQYFRYCDTARSDNYLCQALESDQLPDTGDSFDGSKYINWDYQFSSDSFYFRDEFDSSLIRYSDCRPGFAGFKTAWDYGMTGFPVARYKYLVFAHKGPNLNHKVTVKAWYNNGECGSTDYNEMIGTFNASEAWKEDTIILPDEFQNKDDLTRNKSKYYELVFIITNSDPTDTTSGPAGGLKIDNIRVAGCNPIDTSPKPQQVPEGGPVTFHVSTSRANADDIFTYQWKKDGADIAGATAGEYTITSVTPEHVGEYTVAVTVSSNNLTFTSCGAALTIGTKVVKEYTKPNMNHDYNASSEATGCGCGSGMGLAFIPPLFFKAIIRRKRKKQKSTV